MAAGSIVELTAAIESEGNTMGESTIDVSIILEWENVVLSGEDRTDFTLPELCRQINELQSSKSLRCEVLLVYSTAEFSPEQMCATVSAGFRNAHGSFPVRPIAFNDGAYWEKKNAGAEAAYGEILVLFDSDIAPEPGWLAALLDSFDSSEVQAVAGATYTELSSYYSRAMALFWLFPLRSAGEALIPGTVTYGNNCAFRSDTFKRYKYRTKGLCRGGAADLRRRMEADGILTFVQQKARCSHPPPNGIAHFIRRAACEGHDNVVASKLTTGRAPWRLSYWTIRQRTVNDLKSIRQRYREVGMSRTGAVGAGGIALAYSGFILLGEVLSRINPQIVRKYLWV